MASIVVLGASGMLGSSLVPYLRGCRHNVFTLGREKTHGIDVAVDFSDSESLETSLSNLKPDFIINLIALTNVDVCEKSPSDAYQINVAIVERISRLISKWGQGHLIQISTDQVYSADRLSDENDIDLMNFYSFSKYAGDLVALQVASTVLRTNFFGRSLCGHRSSFTDWLFAKMQLKEQICLFDDVFFSPLSIKNLVRYIELAVTSPQRGVFNLGSRNGLSKFDFGCFFAKQLGFSRKLLLPIKCKDSSLLARRPNDMRMNSAKFIHAFNLGNIPALKDEIVSVVGDYTNEYR